MVKIGYYVIPIKKHTHLLSMFCYSVFFGITALLHNDVYSSDPYLILLTSPLIFLSFEQVIIEKVCDDNIRYQF